MTNELKITEKQNIAETKNLFIILIFVIGVLIVSFTVYIIGTLKLLDDDNKKYIELEQIVSEQKEVIAGKDAAMQELQTRIFKLEEQVEMLTGTGEVLEIEDGDYTGLVYLDEIKLTYYSTVPGVTGTIGSSGMKLEEGFVAMNPKRMEKLGLSQGDEVTIEFADGSREWCLIADHAEADVIDFYVTSNKYIPSWGTATVKLYRKEDAQ